MNRQTSLIGICGNIMIATEKRARKKLCGVEYIATPKAKELLKEADKLFSRVIYGTAKLSAFKEVMEAWEREVTGENIDEEIPFLEAEENTNSKDGNTSRQLVATISKSEGRPSVQRDRKRRLAV
jgi:hypothetical protein